MIIPNRAKKQKQLEDAELKRSGILLGNISTNKNTNRVYVCLIRACLIFLACYGTVGAVVSAFGLSYNYFLVIPFLLVLSTCTAFLYYNRLTFYLGYFALFFIFLIASVALYWHVNSGYQAFSNTVYEQYSNYFGLLSIREGNEYITNRILTVSVAMIFVSFLLCILLNITISGYMNIVETFLITFPILQIALYIDAKPALPYLAMLLAVYITVGILGRSGHYKIPSIKDDGKLFYHHKRKNKVFHSYIYDGPGMLTTGIFSILLSAIFLLITTNIFFSDFGSTLTQNRLKKMTDEYVKTYVQTGIWGLFDRYQASGGLSNGKLGGIGSVRPDFQTDLELTFVPYTLDTMYLKSYVGTTYGNNYFGPGNPETADTDYSLYEQKYSGFSDILQDNGKHARMDIKVLDEENVSILDETGKGFFMPYDSYAIFDKKTPDSVNYQNSIMTEVENGNYIDAFETQYEVLTDLPDSEIQHPEYTVYYLPYETKGYYEPTEKIDASYESYVYDTYLSVPESLSPTLKEFCEEAGLYETISHFEEYDSTTYATEEMQQQALRISIATKLKSYFMNNFKYSLAPGATPYNRDVVEYFLTTQKRGYCAHYASSSALLLRTLGIPTRYVEGYCIPLTAVNDASAVSRDITGWFEGDNILSETGVVTASITDGQAHAWVEIYLDGYGWIPFEFTPPSDDDDQLLNLDFMGIFAGLFLTGNNTDTQTTDTTTTQPLTENKYSFHFDDSFGFILKPLIICSLILVAILLIAYYKEQIAFFYQWKRNIRKGNYKLAIEYEWKYFLSYYTKRDKIINPKSAPREVFIRITHILSFIKEDNSFPESSLDNICNILQQACFSEELTDRGIYDTYHQTIIELRKALRKVPLKTFVDN